MTTRVYMIALILSTGLAFYGCRLVEQKMGNGMDVVEKPWPVWAVAFSTDGRWLATGNGYRSEARFWLGGCGEVNVWRVQDWKQQDGFSAPFTIYVEAIAFTPDSKHLVAASDKYIQSDPKTGGPVIGTPDPWDGNVVFDWTVPDGKRVESLKYNDFRDIPNRGAGSVTSLAISPNGELIALGRSGSVGVVLQRTTGRHVYDVKVNSGTCHGLDFSPNGKILVSLGYEAPLVQLYEAAHGKERTHFELKCDNPVHRFFGEHGYELVGDMLTCVRFSPDGKQIAVGVSDGTVRLLAADLGKQLRSLEVSGDKERVLSLSYAAKADLLAAATASNIRLFEASSGKQLHEWGKADLMASSVALSPDGKLLAVGYGGKHNTKGERRGGLVNIWDTKTGRLVKKLE
jgi:WD40 repeat protein